MPLIENELPELRVLAVLLLDQLKLKPFAVDEATGGAEPVPVSVNADLLVQTMRYVPFDQGQRIWTLADSKQGIATADNNHYLREWFEVNIEKTYFSAESHNEALQSQKKWFPYNKGGDFRKWYGNNEFVVNWECDGLELRNDKKAVLRNPNYYFKECGSWSLISSSVAAFRYKPKGHLFDVAGMSYFSDTYLRYLLALTNSKYSMEVLKVIAPTINYQCGDIACIPVIMDDRKNYIELVVSQNIEISKTDWDSFETSWDFMRHPLVSGQCSVDSDQNANHCSLITDHYHRWERECTDRFTQLKANEEELNRIFIDIYGLQDELTPEVEDKDVTVRKADLGRDVRSFISYAVGCMFGRYSLNTEGLAYAGGEFSEQWVVVSGQLVNRRVVEYYVGKELSRAFGMAEIHGACDRNIQISETSAERGVILTFGSNAESCGFDSVQYRRGTTKKLYEGICELSIDCKGLQCGIADAIYDLCSPEILNAISSGNSSELVGRGWKDADGIDWKTVHYSLTTNHYAPDKDNIIPICDDDYFDDDITGRFIDFVRKVYGDETLEENLRFIADALTTKHSSLTAREIIRNYFLNDFYADHLKIYQKRPIYWLFDSGKKNGFKALIYMHRYQPDLLARMRTDYVHEQQERYRTQLKMYEDSVLTAAPSDKAKLNKQIAKLKDQSLEIQKYEEKIHHLADQMISIDLDDGVKVNYAKFEDVLEKIK